LTLPAAIDVALLFASDAPCRLEIEALTVGYRLIRSSWPTSAATPPTGAPVPPDRDKRRIPLGADASAGSPLLIEVPAGARLERARIAGSLRRGAHHPPGAGLAPLALAATSGVEVVEGTDALQCLSILVRRAIRSRAPSVAE
jgi:hypothetical protein